MEGQGRARVRARLLDRNPDHKQVPDPHAIIGFKPVNREIREKSGDTLLVIPFLGPAALLRFQDSANKTLKAIEECFVAKRAARPAMAT